MFALSGVKEWHDKGYKGKGVKVLVSEPDPTNYHGVSVVNKWLMYAPECEILTFKYENYNEKALVDFAIANGVHFINMSYGINYPDGSFIEDRAREQFKRALDKGIIIIKSAGNYGENGMRDNGTIDERISNVGMVNDKLEYLVESSYDDLGTVDCCGIVGDVLNDGTVLWGTSEACPGTGGLLSCVYFKEKLTPITALQYIAKHSMDINEPGKDNKTGWGVFRLPSFINPLSVKMSNKGKEIFVHKDFVKDGFKKGYTAI
jgi:hypothetical protein